MRADALGHPFRDRALLTRALTHRSSGSADHWERLEFLGDALLGMVVADWLCRHAPDASEGELTRQKQEVVRRASLAAAARRLDLGKRMRLGHGEALTGGREKDSLLADAFEALLGAVYLDGGLRAARAFVLRHLRSALQAALEGGAPDPKTELQEHVQARWHRTPSYRIVRTAGPAHAPSFTSEVLVDARAVGRGSGKTRKQAEQEAARVALQQMQREEP